MLALSNVKSSDEIKAKTTAITTKTGIIVPTFFLSMRITK